MALVERKRGRAAVEDRARILRRDRGLCQVCLPRGRIVLATEVDHIVALINGGDDTDENKQSICRDCHAEKTRQDLGQKQATQIDAAGLPTSPGHHWNTRGA